MQFWCSATGQQWTWTWRAYPGAWLFVLLIAFGYFRLRARHREAWSGGRLAAFLVGLLALWAAIDWPIGTLGSGYLLSVHEVQYLLLGLIAPALILLGIPPAATLGVAPASAWGRALRSFAHPLLGILAYHAALIVTHVPAISDGLMPSQLGSLAIDLSWLLGGAWFWWAVMAPEGISRIRPPLKMGYLFLSTVVPTVPAAFLTFASYPVYRLYELAPPVSGIFAHPDQQTAGIIMKLGADPLIWLAMGIVFFRWARHDAD